MYHVLRVGVNSISRTVWPRIASLWRVKISQAGLNWAGVRLPYGNGRRCVPHTHDPSQGFRPIAATRPTERRAERPMWRWTSAKPPGPDQRLALVSQSRPTMSKIPSPALGERGGGIKGGRGGTTPGPGTVNTLVPIEEGLPCGVSWLYCILLRGDWSEWADVCRRPRTGLHGICVTN